MHRKSRRHSALLLLMAPVIVVGSSALLIGSAGAATSRTTSPRLEVCASTWGASFLVNGKKLTLGKKSCGSVVAKVGSNRVTETSAPAAFRDIASISVSPTKARVSTSVGKATAVVKLAAKAAATVKFVNNRIAHQAGADGAIEVCKYATTDSGRLFGRWQLPVHDHRWQHGHHHFSGGRLVHAAHLGAGRRRDGDRGNCGSLRSRERDRGAHHEPWHR